MPQRRPSDFFGKVRGDPDVDESTVGLSFIDVLFAIVVGYAIQPIGTWWRLSAAGWFHLAVAFFLTLLSWIGYHNSQNRPRFKITPANWPLAQFILDIAMVVTYGLVVLTAEGISSDGDINRDPVAVPEALLVFVAFFLYVLWDLVVLRIRGDVQYRQAWEDKRQQHEERNLPDTLGEFPAKDRFTKKRQQVTWYCLAVAAILLALAVVVDVPWEPGQWAVISLDIVLIVLLVGFRLAKEYVTPSRNKLTSSEDPPPSGTT